MGFVLITGFDKMFNVYIRSARQKIIPAKDLGKTTGVVSLLNNMTQPLAGLLVGLFAGGGQTGLLIVMHSPGTGAIGAVVTVLGSLLGRTAVQAIPARDHREFDLQSREGT